MLIIYGQNIDISQQHIDTYISNTKALKGTDKFFVVLHNNLKCTYASAL